MWVEGGSGVCTTLTWSLMATRWSWASKGVCCRCVTPLLRDRAGNRQKDDAQQIVTAAAHACMDGRGKREVEEGW